MSDDEHLSFTAAAGGASWVEFTWIVPRAGMLGRDKTVPRSQATHAKIVEVGGSNVGDRCVPLVEANAYVAEIERFIAEREATAAAAAKKREAALASVCSHCNVVRACQGSRQLQVGTVGAELVIGELFTVSNTTVHWYVCLSCGSVEQFVDGIVPHPIAGNRPTRAATP